MPVSNWPVYSAEMEFPEEHDQIEHKHLGKKYAVSLMGALKRSIGVAKGRGVYDESKAEVVFPSSYSLGILKQEGNLHKVLGDCRLKVDTGARIPYVRQEGFEF
jgi:hypothetical protein